VHFLVDAEFWTALMKIIGVNIILSGDNAVVIALACRSLPPRQQKWGIVFGAGAAVVLRILFTFVIVALMAIPYLKAAGGLLLFWIGYKLMQPEGEGDKEVTAASNLFGAVRTVLIADAVMSLDNVIAVAGAAEGHAAAKEILIALGLLISIPLVVFGAAILIKLINRFPVIVLVGAGLIGWVGGEVIVTDPAWAGWIEENAHWLHWGGPALGAVAVVGIGKLLAPAPEPARLEDLEEEKR
jgi:YjbE family integral membrane protein